MQVKYLFYSFNIYFTEVKHLIVQKVELKVKKQIHLYNIRSDHKLKNLCYEMARKTGK